MSSEWTDDRIEKMMKLWNEGRSASEIARELGGGTTRNMVIGKVHRVQIADGKRRPQPDYKKMKAGRAPPAAPRERSAPLPREKVAPQAATSEPVKAYSVVAFVPPRPKAPKPAPSQALVLAPPSTDAKCSVYELSHDTCRWPLGDPLSEDFGFCGHPPLDGKPYCNYHTRLAVTAMPTRKRSFGS